MKSKFDYYIVECEDQTYNVLFHQPTSKIAYISKNIRQDDLICDELDKKLERIPKIRKSIELQHGKGKITMTFMSARTCNLGCRYCFAGKGEYEKKDNKPKYFTYKLYMQGLMRGVETYPEGIKRIGFFGGEPLLNFKEIKKFIPECIQVFHQKRLSIPQMTITTNATLLTEEMIDFFKEYKVKLSLSLDGNKEINDRARKFKCTEHSVYDDVVEKCKMLDRKEISYVIQATINANHINQFKKGDAVHWIQSLEKLNYINISIIPVETMLSDLQIVTEEQLQNLGLFSKELIKYFLDKIQKGDIKKIASLVIMPIIQIAKKEYLRSCTSGRSFIWDTDGKAYPCHMFCNENEFLIGDIEEGINSDKSEFLANIDREEGRHCQKCIAKLVCSVWCKGIQFLSNKDVHEVCKARCVYQIAIVEECVKYLAVLGKNRELSEQFWRNYKRFNEELLDAGYKHRSIE
ncbi:radical SAM/SPASM domain-containing protein [Lachnotalea glycerini]|uniref:Radical SAM protein n=1 Tax=Lachnotalea glycerini TaxID=1763509 RepID=A0A371JGR0_9FIRM|nr:radical SAM protein [Lachnotalea glycerini]RDY31930.1 radical SAM protein [Lachnotalea glycerini]